MILALYLAIVVLAALLLGVTWVAAMWGIGPVVLAPLYLIGLIIAAGLVFGVRYIGKYPHA